MAPAAVQACRRRLLSTIELLWKAPDSTVVLFGMETYFKDPHPANARFPMLTTESGMIMDVREEQYSNEFAPMYLTESGIETEVRETHR